jgi:hypothetical protein
MNHLSVFSFTQNITADVKLVLSTSKDSEKDHMQELMRIIQIAVNEYEVSVNSTNNLSYVNEIKSNIVYAHETKQDFVLSSHINKKNN